MPGPIAPIEAYHNRPAVTSQARTLEPAATRRALFGMRVRAIVAHAVQGITYYADWSYYQRVVTAAYPFAIACIRGHSGYMVDPNLRSNVAVLNGLRRVKLVIVYVVYIPGRNAQILRELKGVLGAKCPHNMAFRIDVETGGGFAGKGEHSVGANQLADLLAAYRMTAFTRDDLPRARKGVDGYGNHYDWRDAWSHAYSWIKRAVANYSYNPPTDVWYSWQYAGGDPRWGSPAGAPRDCPPFGSVIDMNLIPKRMDQILLDYGITYRHTWKPKPKPTPRPKPRTHVVRRGETLSGLAGLYGVTVGELVGWNKAAHPSLVSNPNRIDVGWTLRVSK